jgi:UDP-glucose 4-epimerase
VDFVHRVAPRRVGDPAVLVGSSEKAAGALGYQPAIWDIRDIVASAWRVARERPR